MGQAFHIPAEAVPIFDEAEQVRDGWELMDRSIETQHYGYVSGSMRRELAAKRPKARKPSPGALVFPGRGAGQPIPEEALSDLLRKLM